MTRFFTGIILSCLLSISIQNVDGRNLTGKAFKLPSKMTEFINSEVEGKDGHRTGTKWAVLIAGSMGFENYRHQADVCHAYQIMRKGGLRDENIIVFMYDDIASNEENPTRGIILNKPNGPDIYKGVPKDYTGKHVNIDNFFAVLLGNKTALKGGSGKVVDSGPHDHIFVYYSDHGSPGALGLPGDQVLYANDLMDVLKEKHASGTYESLVFYLEACDSGSIFEGLLPEGLNIYATTASDAKENSYATYCTYKYYPCLGDMYSVSWMEDSDRSNLRTETLEEQYKRVKQRTLDSGFGSHVQQYGNLDLNKEHVAEYMGTNQANDNSNFTEEKSFPSFSTSVKQWDADLLYLWNKFTKSTKSSPAKLAARKKYVDAMSHRVHIDQSVKLIAKLMFGIEIGSEVLNAVRPRGRPVVDDWDCFKAMVRTFTTHCGSLYQYGRKHMLFLANICNEGMKVEQMAQVSAQACGRMVSKPSSSL